MQISGFTYLCTYEDTCTLLHIYADNEKCDEIMENGFLQDYNYTIKEVKLIFKYMFMYVCIQYLCLYDGLNRCLVTTYSFLNPSI
jgi:hypothetical protein